MQLLRTDTVAIVERPGFAVAAECRVCEADSIGTMVSCDRSRYIGFSQIINLVEIGRRPIRKSY
jgi:hypothetical protein